MTKDTPPMQGISWEAIPEGIRLVFMLSDKQLDLPMTDVRELAKDMEEANMLSRGYERHEIEMQDVEPLDRLIVAGDIFSVSSTLREGNEMYVLKSLLGDEVIRHQSQLITVYRKIE